MVAFNESNVGQPTGAQLFRGQSRGNFDLVDREVIGILGADCPLGEQIVAISLRCGYEVQALTQGELGSSPDKDLRVLASKTFDARHIQTVVRGSTCVINLCNVSHPHSDPQHPSSESITRNALASMKNARSGRYLCVTHQSVRSPGDARFISHGFGSRYLWPLTHRGRYHDLQKEADLLARSSMDWTLVRCPTIKTVASFGTISVDRHRPTGKFVSRDRLARYLVHLKDSELYRREAMFVASQSPQVRYA
ncbi:NAD(P)H-binding protein [Neorhodopirellula pilleata]|uniref:NAD(P)-binding domain-containing protein n=1 Tax=Neorhodopirellula pilleata TaxID=2714738 RepID=A0A5C6AWI9_9BACT|nr:NAD(P)H-binding protein [Neorhodopirellula pilleata]TWU03436.1 hypothetical protein Pla100_03570 [Neorhodopirellula pilleata]